MFKWLSDLTSQTSDILTGDKRSNEILCLRSVYSTLCSQKPLKSLTCKKAKNTKQFHRVEKDQFQNYRDLVNQLKMTTSVNSHKHSFIIIHYR